MERESATRTVKDEIATSARVSWKISKPILEAITPLFVRFLGKKYRNFHNNIFPKL